jgi:hypothetical protein
MRPKAAFLAGTILSIATLAGCASIEPPMLAPRGDAAMQRFEAQRFDPLPEPDVGPEIVGARGREYERPVAQPSRARWDPRTWVRRFGY